MKAWVLHQPGDIRFEDVEMPSPQKGEVRICVEAAGICASDIPRIYETGAHRMPLVPGHEFAGMVDAVGDGVSNQWIGRHVAIFPKIPCKKCKHCQSGHYDMCTDYDYVGSRRDGAFAEYVSVPAENLLELPDGVTFVGGAMLEPLAVAANAMRTGCQRGEGTLPLDLPVAVCGLGMIGLAVAMLLSDAGYKNIYLIGNKDAAQYRAREILNLPAENICNSRQVDAAKWLMEASDGGVYAYFECTGSNDSILYGLGALAPQGQLILVGNPRSDMMFAKDAYWEILRKQMTVRGIWNSNFRLPGSKLSVDGPDDWNFILQKIQEGGFAPERLVSHKFPLEKLDCGWKLMHEKSEDYCKVMMVR